MPTFKLTLHLEKDGVLLPEFPVVRRLEVDESQSARYEQADDADSGTFDAMPTAQMSEVQMAYITGDQQTTIRVDGQSDAGIVLNSGGLLLIFNADIDAGASTNLTINNASNSTANMTLISGGT